tara:strand:+ start:169 stop:948 length:780 start_codon:yes stop_codon:yes gene_type:complete
MVVAVQRRGEFLQPPSLVTSIKPLRKALKSGHTLIVGQTQYGKTTAALTLFLEPIFDLRRKPVHIFVDTKHDNSILPHGVVARDMSELRFHILMKASHIIYRPPGDDGRVEALTQLIDFLFSLKEDKPSRRGHSNRPVLLFIDEIQLYASKQSKHSGLQRIATTGLGKNIVMCALGQRIQDINQQVYSQCNNTICFFMRERKQYLESQRLEELEKYLPWLRDNKYHFAYLIAGDDRLRFHAPLPLPNKSATLSDILRRG